MYRKVLHWFLDLSEIARALRQSFFGIHPYAEVLYSPVSANYF